MRTLTITTAEWASVQDGTLWLVREGMVCLLHQQFPLVEDPDCGCFVHPPAEFVQACAPCECERPRAAGEQLLRARRGEADAWMQQHLASKHGDDCEDWPYGRSHGYGIYRLPGRSIPAHRYVLTILHPPLDARMQAAHSCGRTICVNPRHLRWATPAENAADRDKHRTTARGERNASAKLSTGDIAAIRASTDTNAELARYYGVHNSHISRIRSGEKWARGECDCRRIELVGPDDWCENCQHVPMRHCRMDHHRIMFGGAIIATRTLGYAYAVGPPLPIYTPASHPIGTVDHLCFDRTLVVVVNVHEGVETDLTDRLAHYGPPESLVGRWALQLAVQP